MSGLEERLLVLLAALALDAAIGDPDWLWRRWLHPVALAGRLIDRLDRAWNREDATEPTRRAAGCLAVLAVLLVAASCGWLASRLAARLPFGLALEAALAAFFLAQNSLYRHVASVAAALSAGGLGPGRETVARIVGRDPQALDEAGVSRAAIESLAENFSDGVVAPVFWYLVAGLPGLVAYKALNTADSMIGHRSPRHLAFGWAAARADDLANLVPARLSALLLALAAGGRAGAALGAAWRDARRHASPNAGWPEAAMGGALGLALGGPRAYRGSVLDGAWMNEGGRAEATPQDMREALVLFVVACLAQAVLVALVLVL